MKEKVAVIYKWKSKGHEADLAYLKTMEGSRTGVGLLKQLKWSVSMKMVKGIKTIQIEKTETWKWRTTEHEAEI